MLVKFAFLKREPQQWLETLVIVLVAGAGALATTLFPESYEACGWLTIFTFLLCARERVVPQAALFSLGMGVLYFANTWYLNTAINVHDDDGYRNVHTLFLLFILSYPVFVAFLDNAPEKSLIQRAVERVVELGLSGIGFGVLVLLLWAWASMMRSIGIEFLYRMLENEVVAPSFFVMMFAVVLATIAGATGQRSYPLSIARGFAEVVAPILVLLVGTFFISAPMGSLSALLDTGSASIILAASILLIVVVGLLLAEETLKPSMVWMLRFLGASLPVLAAIMITAVGIRTNEYGLTPDRIDALVLAAILSAMCVFYTMRAVWSIKTSAAVFVLPRLVVLGCFGVVAVLSSPLVNTYEISARSQVSRFMLGKIPAEKVDYAALQFDLGKPGRAALGELERHARDNNKQDMLRHIGRVRLATERYDVPDWKTSLFVSASSLVQRYDISPKGEVLPPALIKAIQYRADVSQSDACLSDTQRALVDCLLVKGNFTTAHKASWLLIGSWFREGMLFEENTDGTWSSRRVALAFEHEMVRLDDESITAALKAQHFKAVPPTLQTIAIGSNRLQMMYSGSD